MLKGVRGYKGTIMRDEVYKTVLNFYQPNGPGTRGASAFYVMNNDVGNQDTMGGTHWVALALLPEDVMVFDSYGRPPMQELVSAIQNVLDKYGDRGYTPELWGQHQFLPIHYSTVQYQPDKSVACGYYAVYAIKNWSKHRTILDFTKPLEPRDSYRNDLIVMNFDENK